MTYWGLMLVWEGQSLDLQVIGLSKQAVDIDTQGTSSQLAVESGAQTPERMGMVCLNVELLTELAVDLSWPKMPIHSSTVPSSLGLW